MKKLSLVVEFDRGTILYDKLTLTDDDEELIIFEDGAGSISDKVKPEDIDLLYYHILDMTKPISFHFIEE